MPLDTPYAEVNEYRAAVNQSGPGEEGLIHEALVDASRLIDSGYGRPPGTFSAPGDTATERIFDGSGTPRLTLRDWLGVHAFTEVTSVSVSDSVVTGFTEMPRNATTFGLAYEALTYTDGTTWTKGTGNVAVTALWGWPSIPGPIKQLCIKIAHDMLEAHIAGPGEQWQMIDTAVAVQRDTWRLWHKVANDPLYARKVPAVA